jgi:hypothetical protein
MTLKIVFFGLIGLFGSSIVGAQVGGQLTPDEHRMLLQLMLKQQGLGGGSNASPLQPSQTPSVTTAPAVAQVSETELQATFNQWPMPDKGVVFARFRDGFSMNGVRHIDPEGQIVAYGFGGLSGDFTYLAQLQSGVHAIKFGRANSGVEPVLVATAEKRGGTWNITTVTGKRLSGSRLLPSSRGFVVARDNTGFQYTPGKGTSNFSAPEEFVIAALQNGDISKTRHILLERNPAMDSSARLGSAGQLLNTFKSLGSSLGINRKEDYALMNIDTGKLTPINISMEGKQVQLMSECRKRNNLINDCARMDSFESVYKPDGSRNMSHYFWRISWLQTSTRTLLISQEGGLGTITATDLNTGKKVVLFERALGIANFEVQQNVDGTLDISAQMGLSQESKKDIAALMDTLPGVEASK